MSDDDPKLVLDHRRPVRLSMFGELPRDPAERAAADNLDRRRIGPPPKTRGECCDGSSEITGSLEQRLRGERHCFARCKHNLFFCEGSERPGKRYRGEEYKSTLTGNWVATTRSCALDEIDRRDGQPMNTHEIAAAMGISHRRVEQLLKRAVETVRAAKLDVELEDPVHDYAVAGDRPIGRGRSDG